MIKVDGYVCSFCRAAKDVQRVYASPGSCKRHEDSCYRNPTQRACATCALWQEAEFGAGTHDEPALTVIRRACQDEHDRDDVGMCSGHRYPPRPQRGCEHWVSA